jgi:hypothetical protein
MYATLDIQKVFKKYIHLAELCGCEVWVHDAEDALSELGGPDL